MKLSLTMIVKDGLDDLKRLKPIVENYIDEWVVVFPPGDKAIGWAKKNGIKAVVKDCTQEIEPRYVEKMAEYGVELTNGSRMFNFAMARNLSLSEASGDYILWLDADDEPVGLERLLDTLERKNNIDMLECVYDYSRDSEGNSISDHVRERVFKNDGRFEWRGGKLGLIHETVVPKPGVTPRGFKLSKDIFYVKHHSDHHNESSDRNFIALLYEYLATDGEDPRTIYYLGTEFFNHGMFAESIKVMQEYIGVGGWDEERYRAWIRVAECYHQLGDKGSSRNAYLSAIKELPERPDAYLGLGESYHSDEEWQKAIEFMMTGLQKKLPDTKSGVDITRYTFRPLVFIALSYMQLGKQDEAYQWFMKARRINPKHDWVREYEPTFVALKERADYIRHFMKLGQLTKRLYPSNLAGLADAIPDELMSHEVLFDFRRRFARPKVWGDKSIVYYCSEAFEEWGPDSLERGCGGSEEAVIHLTRRWAAMGYEVTVYNNCPEEKTVDGVTWLRHERFNPRDVFNILIAWRNNPFLEPRTAKKRFIDVHDVPNLRYYPVESTKGVNLMVKSQYHRSLFPEHTDDNFTIINNGIDFGQFTDIEKVKNNLVWTSSYDRGLEQLLTMWPAIRRAVPDATLDVAYGWNLFDTSPFGKTTEGRAWRAKMDELLIQDGVTHHGRLNSDTVAGLYRKADVWAYPTAFPEIDCITATKAMAAGCVPVTTDFAVMRERNQGVMIEGDITEQVTQDQFQAELIALLQDEDRKAAIRESMDVSTFSWDSVAERWAELF